MRMPTWSSQGGWGVGRIGVLLALMALGALEANAQYNVFAWFRFDEGRLDAQAIPLGMNPGERVFIYRYADMASPPRGFWDAVAQNEIRSHGLMLRTRTGTVAEEFLTGLASNIILERHRLGDKGRALFQADFYIPPATYAVPSLAVLAMEPLTPGQTAPASFYRFGVTKSRDVYFSHVIAGATEAAVYKFDRAFLGRIPRGSWHRFAIVVEGQSTIRCYVDGNEAPFSPIQDDTLKMMQVGVMMAEGEAKYDAFIDNLSIQWTNEDVPLPDSPWAHTWTGSAPVRLTQPAPAATPGSPVAATPGAPDAAAGPLAWFDVESGWEQAKAQQKSMLVYFLAPRLPITLQLDKLINDDPAAQAYLKQFSCVKVDVNQLQGGTYAAQYNIFKVPTFIVFNLQGQEAARAVFNRNDTWATFSEKLQQP